MLIVSTDYGFHGDKITDEQLLVFWEHWPCIKKAHPDFSKFTRTHVPYRASQRCTMEEIYALEEAGIPLEIEGVDGTMLTKIRGRADKYGDVTGEQLRSGAVVQITVPDLGLLAVNEVDWLDDACTQDVQAKLAEGWRILAVCPPNAQRRPDYIFGRSRKPE